MYSTGIFTIHQYTINIKKLDEPIYLIPFGDIHRSANLCHVDKWLEFLEWAKNKENAIFIGMGDYDELVSSRERNILLNENLHNDTKSSIENTFKQNTNRLVKEIGFMKGKLIGFLEGNHYGTFPSGMTTTQLMCDLLDTKYLGVCNFTRLSFHYYNGKMRTSIDIFSHHGKGAARLIGGSLNKVQQMSEIAFADIHLQGHDHRKSIGTKSLLQLKHGSNGLRLSHKKQLFIRTGSFLKGYEDNKISYVTDAMMNPTDLGVVKIELTPKRKRTNDDNLFYIDLHASI